MKQAITYARLTIPQATTYVKQNITKGDKPHENQQRENQHRTGTQVDERHGPTGAVIPPNREFLAVATKRAGRT